MCSNLDLKVASSKALFIYKFLVLLFLCRFVCDNCLKKTGRTRKENKFSAKSKFDVSSCVFNFYFLPAITVFFFCSFFNVSFLTETFCCHGRQYKNNCKMGSSVTQGFSSCLYFIDLLFMSSVSFNAA